MWLLIHAIISCLLFQIYQTETAAIIVDSTTGQVQSTLLSLLEARVAAAISELGQGSDSPTQKHQHSKMPKITLGHNHHLDRLEPSLFNFAYTVIHIVVAFIEQIIDSNHVSIYAVRDMHCMLLFNQNSLELEFCNIWIKMQEIPLMKIHLIIPSAKCQASCLGLHY